MLIDARSLEDGQELETELCIIGAGPAGLALALEFEGTGTSVCVVESGGIDPDPAADALNTVETTHLPIDPDSRTRALGGTAKRWYGRWRPMEAMDLARRAWVPRSGWPFGPEELEPYYRRAAVFAGSPGLHAFGLDALEPAASSGSHPLFSDDLLATNVHRWLDSAHWDLGAHHRPALDASSNISVLLHATVVSLETDAGGRSVSLAAVLRRDRSPLGVRARRFVLAAGGIENPRLLLLSRGSRPNGLGDEHGQVGRHFMEHPKGTAGELQPLVPLHLPAYWGFMKGDRLIRAGVELAPAAQREQGALNSFVILDPVYDWSESEGVRALKRLVMRRHDRDREWVEQPPLAQEVVRMARGLPVVARFVARKVGEGFLGRKRIPDRVVLRNYMEQAPDPDNRVFLTDRRDALGCRKAGVTWRIGELDRRGVRALHGTLAKELERRGMARLESPLLGAEPGRWPINQDASHHMGTTRMGSDPRTSVVDPDGCVHGVDNLYVAGSSVFPTSGHSGPTATLLALAIRLADHLKR